MKKNCQKGLGSNICFPPNSLLLGFSLRKKELATVTGRAHELCVRLCVRVLSSCPPLVLLLCCCCPLAALTFSIPAVALWQR